VTRIALGLAALLFASLGASAQSKITLEHDAKCHPTSWNGNTVQCGAWAHTFEKDGRQVVWTLGCAQQKDNTNDCLPLVAGTYTYDVLKQDSICDPNTGAPCIQRRRILMKLHAKPADAIYTALETGL
jgi:hypothetical protein